MWWQPKLAYNQSKMQNNLDPNQLTKSKENSESKKNLEPGQAIRPQSPEQIQAEQEKAQQLQHNTEQYDKDIEDLNKTVIEENSDITDSYEPEKKRSIFKELLIWAGVTVLIVLIIQNFIFQAFYVSGSSMEPDYHNDDYLIISKIPLSTYNIAKLFGQKNMNIQRGDILVFRYPNAPDTFFIKRALALPGERITIKDGLITIYNKQNPDGLVLKEDYIDPQYRTMGDIDEVIEDGKVFVAGDNRSEGGSFDSREWGQLPQQNITGFAALRLLPISDFSIITDPSYQ